MMPFTLEQLQHVYRSSPASRLELFLEPLTAALEEFSINVPRRSRPFLAQVGEESMGLRYVRELADGKGYDGREDLGNTDPVAIEIATRHGTTPGPLWKGHGLLQITGYRNHCFARDALGIDCVEHPTLLEEPLNACRSAAWFWRTGAGLNLSKRAKAAEIPVGVDLNDLADAGEFEKITLAINGGLTHLESRKEYLKRAEEVIP